ncbi:MULTISPECIES: hypothetical protein [Vibrio]|uniref:Uncharacterized protein n=2 Tax=Vibrio TaxID=662 RepID=F9S0Z0_9VIBR|nr:MULTISPECIES: hypothetical protein [Vibrio]EGU42973.1 hypothetical protein VII00023_02944 [Vibrio ichthyoenteri ATCC 700023]ODS10158.1 hypothetical protein VSF3289_00413 [Vibrio scophthalmi]
MAIPLLIPIALVGAVALVKTTGDTVEQTGDAVEQSGNAALKFAVFAAVAAGAYIAIKGAR